MTKLGPGSCRGGSKTSMAARLSDESAYQRPFTSFRYTTLQNVIGPLWTTETEMPHSDLPIGFPAPVRHYGPGSGAWKSPTIRTPYTPQGFWIYHLGMRMGRLLTAFSQMPTRARMRVDIYEEDALTQTETWTMEHFSAMLTPPLSPTITGGVYVPGSRTTIAPMVNQIFLEGEAGLPLYNNGAQIISDSRPEIIVNTADSPASHPGNVIQITGSEFYIVITMTISGGAGAFAIEVSQFLPGSPFPRSLGSPCLWFFNISPHLTIPGGC